MLGCLPDVMTIDEPTIGSHLGLATGAFVGLRAVDVPRDRMRVNELLADRDDYVFADRYADVWRPLVRDLVLGRYGAQVADHARETGRRPRVVCCKEPHGSIGADVLLGALPDARLLVLLRDGRDVVDSELDAASAGSWATGMTAGFAGAEQDRLAYVRDRAHLWVARTMAVQRAHEAHDPARRMTVRYEDLLDDPAAHLGRVVAWLGLDVDAGAVAEVADALAVDNVPDHQRGPGHFVRAARPGGWRTNLTDEEQAELERIAGPTLRELGYA